MIPRMIEEWMENKPYTVDKTGMSGSQVLCFDHMILRIEEQGEASEAQHQMMTWLAAKLSVPEILCEASQGGLHYLLMSRMAGATACSPQLMEEPDTLVYLMAEGLRLLWSVDTSGCPRICTIDRKLAQAEKLLEAGLCHIENADPGALLQCLERNKPEEELIFFHVDYCLPNLFIRILPWAIEA